MANILYSFLDYNLDNHKKDQWRPSVAVATQEDFHIDEYHIWYQAKYEQLLDTVFKDVHTSSPKTTIIPELLELQDPYDFEEVYARLYDYSRRQKFTPEENQYYIHITTGSHVMKICLFLLTESRNIPGKLIQTNPNGNNRAIGKYSIIDLNLSRYDKLAQRFNIERKNYLAFLKSDIDTKNRHFNSLIEIIERVAVQSEEPILLTGPTGAGKSRLAQKIYDLKMQKNIIKGKFVKVNCATLRGDQAMSTLFGHTRGAFTGAVKKRSGLLKTAENGMLFLDEIGELGLDEQATLLGAIEEKKFRPVGEDEDTTSSFQLICGTNRNLHEAIKAGRFRYDLYQRINLWEFQLPGLSERREDIAPNVEYELNNYFKKTGHRITFNREAQEAFMNFAEQHDWPGNFRELNAIITRMATLAPGGRIDLPTVQKEIATCTSTPLYSDDDNLLIEALGKDYTKDYDYFELIQLREVIKVCRESKNRSEAGRKLYSVSRLARKTKNDADRLGNYLKRFNLNFPELKKL